MRKRYKHGSSVIGSKVEKARWLLASNEPLACRVEVEAATDLLLRVLWARLPDVLPDDLSAELEAASAGGEIDPVAPSARQIMELGSRIGLASMIESATRVGTVGLGWLFEYAADAGEGEDPRSRLETHLSALEMALDELLDQIELFLTDPRGPERGMEGIGSHDQLDRPRKPPAGRIEQKVEGTTKALARAGDLPMTEARRSIVIEPGQLDRDSGPVDVGVRRGEYRVLPADRDQVIHREPAGEA